MIPAALDRAAWRILLALATARLPRQAHRTPPRTPKPPDPATRLPQPRKRPAHGLPACRTCRANPGEPCTRPDGTPLPARLWHTQHTIGDRT